MDYETLSKQAKAEYQDWSGERTILEMPDGTDLEFCGESVNKHRSEDRLYRYWFSDGDAFGRLRWTDKTQELAAQYGLDPDMVCPGCDLAIKDEFGEDIGGLMFEGWARCI